MGLEDQEVIHRLAQEHGRENVVVLLGAPDSETSEVYAETVTHGDPTFAGPLAGVSLGLPVYHILEDEIKNQIESQVYESQIGMMEMVLDKEDIMSKVSAIRNLRKEA
jgi:glycine reductase